MKGFYLVDYFVFTSVLFISVVIGLYHAFQRRKNGIAGEFTISDSKVKTFPISLSILVSFVSAISILGTPAEVYTHGTQLLMRIFGHAFGCVIASLIFVPLFYKLQLTSTFEYLDRRYKSKILKKYASFMMIVGNVFYMGLLLYAPSTALQTVSGLSFWITVISTGLISTMYTALGGIRGVIWTDVFQGVVMIVGIITIVISGIVKVGGIKNLFLQSYKENRIQFFNFSLDPTERLTFWSTVVGGAFSSLAIFGIGQSSVQRYVSLPSLSQAKRAIYYNIPGLILVNIITGIIGLVIFTYYHQLQCDPLKTSQISNANQLVPFFIIDALQYPGFSGIILAVIFSGSLSSLSSVLNSLAAVTWEDFFKDFCFKQKVLHQKIFSKILVIVYGLLGIVVSFIASRLGSHVLYASLSFTGATLGPSFGLFLLGSLTRTANSKGAITGCIISTAFSLWIAIGAFLTNPYRRTRLPTSIKGCNLTQSTFIINSTQSNLFLNLTQSTTSKLQNSTLTATPLEGIEKLYGLSFLWYTLLGATITFAVGLIVSYFTGGKDQLNCDDQLIIPLKNDLLSCLPHSLKRYLHFSQSRSSLASPQSNKAENFVTKSSPSNIQTKVLISNDSSIKDLPLELLDDNVVIEPLKSEETTS